MSLLKENEEMKAQLAEALEAEKEEEEQEESAEESVEREADDAEEAPVEKKTEEAAEQKTEEPKKEEVKEEKQDDSAFARLRREAAANKRKADELERENSELKKPKEEVFIEETSTMTPELAEVVRDYQMNRAEREFQSYESQAKNKLPDYEGVTRGYAEALFGSIKIQNPRMSNLEIAEKTKETLLKKAGSFLNQGFENPAEELYHEAKELGFKAAASREPEKEAKPELRPDMNKVAENRKRSAGMTGVAGREDGLVSKTAAAKMSPMEWKELPREERLRLMSV